MASRILEFAVALAALASAVLLGAMLAAPFLPQPSAPVAFAAISSPSASAEATAGEPPIGLFQVRGRLAFSGPCMGLVLSDASYPPDGSAGSARVTWWTPTAVDPGNPQGCATRAGDLNEVAASVTPVVDEDEPEADPRGYSVQFRVPLFETDPASRVEIVILLSRSTPDQLQALVLSPEGSPGLVLERVESIDPPFEPRPSATPIAVVPPDGLFLHQGPVGGDGPCLVLELGESSYPVDVSAVGTARVRSWEPANRDPNDPARCLTRRGEIHEAEASVVASVDPRTGAVAYEVSFSVAGAGSEASEPMLISFDGVQRPDQLRATLVERGGSSGLVFDRIDEIDPPLAP